MSAVVIWSMFVEFVGWVSVYTLNVEGTPVCLGTVKSHRQGLNANPFGVGNAVLSAGVTVSKDSD